MPQAQRHRQVHQQGTRISCWKFSLSISTGHFCLWSLRTGAWRRLPTQFGGRCLALGNALNPVAPLEGLTRRQDSEARQQAGDTAFAQGVHSQN